MGNFIKFLAIYLIVTINSLNSKEMPKPVNIKARKIIDQCLKEYEEAKKENSIHDLTQEYKTERKKCCDQIFKILDKYEDDIPNKLEDKLKEGYKHCPEYMKKVNKKKGKK